MSSSKDIVKKTIQRFSIDQSFRNELLGKEFKPMNKIVSIGDDDNCAVTDVKKETIIDKIKKFGMDGDKYTKAEVIILFTHHDKKTKKAFCQPIAYF